MDEQREIFPIFNLPEIKKEMGKHYPYISKKITLTLCVCFQKFQNFFETLTNLFT